MSNKKGQLSKWVNKNDNNILQGIEIPGRLNFSIYKNPNMVADWNIDDFREIISVGNAVKYTRLKCLIDVFVEPERYINANSGNPYLDDIFGKPKTRESVIKIIR